MRAVDILQQQLADGLRSVHATRLVAVFAAVHAVFSSRILALSELGRAIAAKTSHKHGIKRVDRLLGNARLQAQVVTFYRAISARLIRPGTRPIVLVDWTAVTSDLWALSAAIAFEGRALTFYSETHPTRRYLKPAVHKAFLKHLATVLPAGCRPIIVTDAGFRTPWMRAVEKLGWDYVGRIRQSRVRLDGETDWQHFSSLWPKSKPTATDVGRAVIGLRARFVTRLVTIRRRGAIAKPVKANESRHHRPKRTAREPWVLATSLQVPPAEVVGIYKLRMQIEETFRDTKSVRFGFALSLARTNSVARAEVLVLLAALAHLTAVLVGQAVEAAGVHLRYQANSVKDRRVLSWATLGRLVAAESALMAALAQALSGGASPTTLLK